MARALSAVWFIALGLAAQNANAQTKLLRFPDLYGDKVAFCYAGDLWTAPAAGGTATRLTAHPGLEVFPKFSPDGQWIAFTGQYDGDEQVYVIPAAGGIPKQLTFYPARGPLAPRWGYDNQVYGWTRDGKNVQVRSMYDNWNQGETRQYLVPVSGGLPRPLPMPVSGAADFSPDEKRMVYNPTARDFRTWKRYQGGWQQDLYLYDLATAATEKIIASPRTDRDPMWIGDKIYFNSDRDGHLNLYAYDLGTRNTAQITHETVYDVRWPSDDDQGRVVFELKGELRILDTRTGQATPVSIQVPSDGVASRPLHVSVDRLVEDFELSPKGERALFVARGDVFTVPIEKGPTRNLTHTSNAHEKWARWSPDGKRVAYISDAAGEEQVYIANQDGSGAPEQITTSGAAQHFAAEWSPDGKRLAFADKDGKVFVVTVGGKKLQEIADDRHDQVRDYIWSPDSRWLAFSLADDNGTNSIWIWGGDDNALHRVTDENFSEFNPVWDPDGNYLYYLSNRQYEPQISSVEWNFATDRMTALFAMALRKDVKHPFPPESDEVSTDDVKSGDKADAKTGDEAASGGKSKKGKKANAKDAAKADGDADKKAEAKPIRIDFDGLATRVALVPVPADDYSGLAAVKGHLLYVRSAAGFYGRDAVKRPELHIFELKTRKETTLAENVGGYVVSGDGSKVLVQQDQAYKLYDATPKGKDSAKAVATSGMASDIVPAQEWAEMFDEVWRRYRDYFYVANMHGYDWEALGKQYRALLPYVGHRSDLNYVLGEMVAELNCSHSYIAGGDFPTPPRAPVALPGARFELDPQAGRYRIAKIFQGQNEEERYRSPLTEVGVDARVGDYVMAIDGEELRGNDSPYRLLRYKADRPVTLQLNSKPSLDGARAVTYRPVSSEIDLLYLDMVAGNRARVDRATQGKIGYIHIPDMGANGIREFVKTFYPQVRKQGMIVDVRSNGGGNVSQMIIERLRRQLLGTRFGRQDEDANTYPDAVLFGPKVCLLDENSSSDGDIFPHMFRQAKIGPLIGKRSWGGVVGISGHGPLLDGGQVSVPESGTNAPTGEWVIEGHGVDPDIEVEQDPAAVIAGHDPQLERGIEEVLRLLQQNPGTLPARPAAPVKNK